MSQSQSTDILPQELATKFHSAQAAIASERKLVSVVFADLSGFTALSEKLDPEKVTEIVNQCFQRLGRVVYEFEGYIDKFMGDCIMALFGAPLAHENDPELAIDCSLKMLAELKTLNRETGLSLEMSIGINSGMVIAGGVGTDQKFEYTVMGDVVNVAQRLQSSAKRDQILVSRSIQKICSDKFEFEALPPIHVKGKEAPLDVFAVKGRKKIELKDKGIQSGYSKLIGREKEVQIVEKLLDGLPQKRGQILLMLGEPGVGKSRFKHEMKKLAHARGYKWYEAKCSSLKREAPYFVFIDLLHHLLEIDTHSDLDTQKNQMQNISKFKLEPMSERLIRDFLNIHFDQDEPIPLSGDQKRRALFVAIKNLLLAVSQESPATIYFEDLHWMDPVSKDLLSSILDGIAETSLLIAGGARSDWSSDWNQKRAFTQIALNALTVEQSLELVQSILKLDKVPDALKKLIESKSDGNPLYIEEIVKSLIDANKITRVDGQWEIASDIENVEIPQTVHGIISSRIDQLQENDKLILQYASTIGRKFSDVLLARVTGLGSSLYESLKYLRKKELIFEFSSEYDETVYIFNHALMQEVAYQSILIKTRKLFHKQVALAIEELTGDESVEELAFHYVEAGVDEKAIYYLTKSGNKMADLYNNSGAIEAYRRAIEILEKSATVDKPDRRLFELYVHISRVQILTGDLTSAEKVLFKLLELGKSRNDELNQAISHRKLGEINSLRGNFELAIEEFQHSLEHSTKIDDFLGQIKTYKGIANAWKKLNNFSKALEFFDQGIQGAKALQHSHLLAEYLNDKATLLIELNKLDEAKIHLEESISISEKESTYKSILISSTLNLGVVQYFQKDIQGALLKFRNAAKLSEQIGDLTNKLIAKHNIGEMLVEFKQYAEALIEFEESYKIAKDIGNDLERLNNRILVGYMKTKLRAPAEGQKILNEAIEESRQRKFWSIYCSGLLCLVDFFFDSGDSAMAESHLELAFRKAEEIQNQPILGQCEEARKKLETLKPKNSVPKSG